eukprot:3495255-Pleurochrysis_carterae.AAC.5
MIAASWDIPMKLIIVNPHSTASRVYLDDIAFPLAKYYPTLFAIPLSDQERVYAKASGYVNNIHGPIRNQLVQRLLSPAGKTLIRNNDNEGPSGVNNTHRNLAPNSTTGGMYTYSTLAKALALHQEHEKKGVNRARYSSLLHDAVVICNQADGLYGTRKLKTTLRSALRQHRKYQDAAKNKNSADDEGCPALASFGVVNLMRTFRHLVGYDTIVLGDEEDWRNCRREMNTDNAYEPTRKVVGRKPALARYMMRGSVPFFRAQDTKNTENVLVADDQRDFLMEFPRAKNQNNITQNEKNFQVNTSKNANTTIASKKRVRSPSPQARAIRSQSPDKPR